MSWKRDKAISTILYISPALAEKSRTLGNICAILYRADKLHLGKYARTICNDEYEATINGTRPTQAHWLMTDPAAADLLKEQFEVRDGLVFPMRPHDPMEFSKSDQECLDKALAEFFGASEWELEGWTKDWAWEIVTYGGSLFRHDPVKTYPIGMLGVALSCGSTQSLIRALYDHGDIR